MSFLNKSVSSSDLLGCYHQNSYTDSTNSTNPEAIGLDPITSLQTNSGITAATTAGMPDYVLGIDSCPSDWGHLYSLIG